MLLPKGFRFSPSTERPDWTEEALKPLRDFHARYAGPNGEPPLAAHLAATLKHRDRLTRDGTAAIAVVAAEEKLNATYSGGTLGGAQRQVKLVSGGHRQLKQWYEANATATDSSPIGEEGHRVALEVVETSPRGIEGFGGGLDSL